MRVPRELLRSTIVIEDFQGAGALGPTYGAPRSVKASVQQVQRLILDVIQREVMAEGRVIIRPEDGPVAVESRVTYLSKMYRVIRAYPYPDERRPTQWELMIGSYAQ